MIYIEVSERRAGAPYADFNLYLPTGRDRFVQYRFVYVECPPKPALFYEGGANDPANSRLYRVREAYIGRLAEGGFSPDYRILQGGLIQLLEPCQKCLSLGLPEHPGQIGLGKITVFLKHSIASCSLG